MKEIESWAQKIQDADRSNVCKEAKVKRQRKTLKALKKDFGKLKIGLKKELVKIDKLETNLANAKRYNKGLKDSKKKGRLLRLQRELSEVQG